MTDKDTWEDIACFRYLDGNCQVAKQKLVKKEYSTSNAIYSGVSCVYASHGKLCAFCTIDKL